MIGFYINLPIGGLVAILLISVHLPDSSKPRDISILQTVWIKLDPLGFILFAPSTIQLLLALEYGGNTYPWNSATIIGLFCGAGGTFILFLLWEYFKGDDAMIPLSMMTHRGVWSSCLVSFFFFSMMQLVVYYLPIYFQAVKGVSPMISGVDLLPSILSQLIGTSFSGITGKSLCLDKIDGTNSLDSSDKIGLLPSLLRSRGGFGLYWSRLDFYIIAL
jgi:hypothetical protein